MITLPSQKSESSVLLFGMECAFTAQVLGGLVADGIPIASIILPGPAHLQTPFQVTPKAGTLLAPPSESSHRLVADIGHQAGVPVYRVGDLLSADTQALLGGFTQSRMLSVCYPRRIPTGVLTMLPEPALNVHPSLLPDLRGPDPLFWTFHRGDGSAGLTIHIMNDRFDAGPVVWQAPVSYEDGTTEVKLDEILAVQAVNMLSELFLNDTSHRTSPKAQREEDATYAPHPSEEDFKIGPGWTVRRAVNFVCGIAGRRHPITYRDGAESVRVLRLRPVTSATCSTPGSNSKRLLEFDDGLAIAEV